MSNWQDLLTPERITCDTREPGGTGNTDPDKTRIAAEIERLGIPALPPRTLPCGDYGGATFAGDLWLIERKEANDFLSSLTTGRLYDQVRRLLEAPVRFRFLLPEGQLVPGTDGRVRTSRGKSEWDYKAIYHAWIELTALGINMLPFVPREYTARAIVQVRETLNIGPKYVIEKHGRNGHISLHSQMNLPRRYMEPLLGRVVMDNMYDAGYPNMWTILTAAMLEPKKLEKVPRSGPSVTKKLRELLTTPIRRSK